MMARVLALLAIFALTACSAAAQTSPPPKHAHRVVALMPSFAEDVCAVGARDELVGVSEFGTDMTCTRDLPQVNNFSSVNTEKIVALRADAVLALPSQRALTAGLVRAGIPVVYMSDDSYGDIFRDLARIGALTGHAARANALVSSLKQQTNALTKHAEYGKKPSVMFVEQAMPLWTVGPGSYIATLIQLAGGRLATSDLHRPYAQYSDEALLRANPDVIIATADAHVDQVLDREPWRSLRAVREHHIFIDADSNALVRPSPHYIAGLQWLIARFSSL